MTAEDSSSGFKSALQNKEFRSFVTYLVFVVLFSVGKERKPHANVASLALQLSFVWPLIH